MLAKETEAVPKQEKEREKKEGEGEKKRLLALGCGRQVSVCSGSPPPLLTKATKQLLRRSVTMGVGGRFTSVTLSHIFIPSFTTALSRTALLEVSSVLLRPVVSALMSSLLFESLDFSLV